MPQARLEVGNTLQALRVSFEENRPLVLRLTLGLAFLIGATSLLDVAGAAGLAISFGIAIFLGAAYGGMITALICLPGKSEGIGELWTAVKSVVARLIWLTLLTAVAFVLGFAAFFIPSIFIVIFWCVAGQTIVVERRGVFESLGRSYELVKGNAWRVFLYLLVIGILSLLFLGLALLAAAPFGDSPAGNFVGNFLSSLLSTSVVALGLAALYNQLIDIHRAGPVPDEPEDEEAGTPG